MNQVKNISLNEVRADVHEDDDHQPVMDSTVRSWRSMLIKQSIESASVDVRGAVSLPDATSGIVTADEAGSSKDKLPERRSRTMAEKEKSFRLSTLKGMREKINARLKRKSSTIEDLLFSTRNFVAVKEEFAQFNYLFKMLPGIHEEYNALLKDEERAIDDDWFDSLDNRVCAFKRKTLNWVNSAREEQQSSRHSSRSSRSRSSIHSRRSSASKGFRSSKSSKEKDVEDRVKIAELLAQAQYVEQRQQIENQAEMLKIKQEIAEAKARVEAYSWKEMIYEKATDRKILAPRMKTSDEKEKHCP